MIFLGIMVPDLSLAPGAMSIPWPLFALAYCVAEVKVIDVRFRGGSHTFSLTEVPAVIGLFFVDPQWYVIGLVAGAAAALVYARQPLAKLSFNLAQYLLGAVASVVTFYLIAGLGGVGHGRDLRRFSRRHQPVPDY